MMNEIQKPPSAASFLRNDSLFYGRDLFVLFSVAMISRLILLALGLEQLGAEVFLQIPGDSLNYVRSATELAKGSGNYEYAFYTFGPGYASFLGLQFRLFGISSIPPLLINITVSALTSSLVYCISWLLGFSRLSSIIAGAAVAFSVTSISLSNILLSDTLYLFLLALGLVLFLRGIKADKWGSLIGAGLLFSAAILTRTIGQLLPVALIVVFLVSGLNEKLGTVDFRNYFRSRWPKVAVCVGIILLSTGSWMWRNYQVHSHATLAFTSVGAPARVAGVTLEQLTGTPEKEIRIKWVEDYKKRLGKTNLEDGELYDAIGALADTVWAEHRWKMIKVYVNQVWISWNDISYIHRTIIPELNGRTIPLEEFVKRKGLNFLPIIISFLGLIILLAGGHYKTLIILASLYFYHVFFIGFYRWQGSRYFLPALVAEAPLYGIVLVSAYSQLRQWYLAISTRITSQ